MNYEFYDYRKNKKPELGPWLTYMVPKELAFDYCCKLFLYTYLLPWLFGLSVTALGIACLTVAFDYVYYRFLKHITS